jgi:hypothetical protein
MLMRSTLRLLFMSPLLASALVHCGSSDSDTPLVPAASGGSSGSAGATNVSGGSGRDSNSSSSGGVASGGVTSGGRESNSSGSAGADQGGEGGAPTPPEEVAGTGGTDPGSGEAGAGGKATATGGASSPGGESGAGGDDSTIGGSDCRRADDPAASCSDRDACTVDACDGAGSCTHDNPTLDCSAWSGGACAGDAILAAAAGERTICVPEQTVGGNIRICAEQTCAGAAGCSVTYRTQNPVVTATDAGYRLDGSLAEISGQVSGTSGAVRCTFNLGLAGPAPFSAVFGLSRPDCSEYVTVATSVEGDWSNLTLGASGLACTVVAGLLRSQVNTSLDAAVARAFDSLECAACDDSCRDGVSCR